MVRSSRESVTALKAMLAELLMLTEHYARLFALVVIDEADFRRKSAIAEGVVEIFHAAVQMQLWAQRQFHASSSTVTWHATLNPQALGALANGKVERRTLDALLADVWHAMRVLHADLVRACSARREFAHWTSFASKLISSCPSSADLSSAPSRCLLHLTPCERLVRLPTKTVEGPSNSRIDPVFSTEYSLQDFAAPVREDRIDSIIPYFWTLSTREAMVCDSCLLSAVEYDGLPLSFYQDMAQQAADEARHAVMYLDLAIELMPTYLDRAKPHDRTAATIRKFIDGSGKLPIPYEGNLFSCMWHAGLEERLIIMQVTTEGAAVSATRRAIGWAISQEFPSVQRAFEVDYFDEVAHTRIGTRWLRYVCPNSLQRKEAIEDTKLLRGALLLTCFSSNDPRDTVANLMGRYQDRRPAGTDYFATGASA